MLSNLPVKRYEHKDLTIEGYSRAAVQTYWRVPELKIGFDLGAQPWAFMSTPQWFISHTHLDHIAALPVLAARRRMMKMDPPTIYLPEQAVEPVERMLRAFRKLDFSRMPCELVPVSDGSEVELSRELVVEAFATQHTITSLGYLVCERRQKLKSEYQDLAGFQIRDLKLSGVEITREVRVPLVAYMGDTAPGGLDDNPQVYDAKVLITEVTFLESDHRPEEIHKDGHTHLDDLVERQDRFRNELIVIGHFSTRYHNKQIRSLVEEALPDLLDGRLQVWV